MATVPLLNQFKTKSAYSIVRQLSKKWRQEKLAVIFQHARGNRKHSFQTITIFEKKKFCTDRLYNCTYMKSCAEELPLRSR